MPTPEMDFFYAHLEEMRHLQDITSALEWDESVMMPHEGAEDRALQLGFLSKLLHEKKTAPQFLVTVDSLAEQLNELSENDHCNIREVKKDLDRSRKFRTAFVERLSMLSSQAYQAWTKAKSLGQAKLVLPLLTEIVEMNREKAEVIGYRENPYDALLDEYEPGLTFAQIHPLLDSFGSEIRPLIDQAQGLITDCHALPLARNVQEKILWKILNDLGFRAQFGRLDSTPHPFANSLGRNDHRITTRFHLDNFYRALSTTLHEAGHALYGLGLPKEFAGTPRGSAISLGVHESQSRFWENFVGRSKEFCTYLFKVLEEYLPPENMPKDPNEIWQSINRVQPSLIRVEADELTYNLHILIRLELEELLITGKLQVKDLPDAWATYYKKHLGISASNPAESFLQDVHWFRSAFGYFPTYALGNIYAAMFHAEVKNSLPSYTGFISSGDFGPIVSWLRENIHSAGMLYGPLELIERASRSTLSTSPFLNYAKEKFLSS